MDIFNKLKAPFDPSDIEFRVGSTTRDKSKGLALAYVTSRAIMDRLDSVVGPTEWTNKLEMHNDGVVSTLSIRIGGEWVSRQDGAQYTNIESFKGGISDALKRVAVLFGIGRYLYTLPQAWVELDNGRITGDAIKKLRKEMEHFSGSYTRVKNTPKVTDGMTPKQKHYSGEDGMPLDDIGQVELVDLPMPDDVKERVAKNVAKTKGKIDFNNAPPVRATREYEDSDVASALGDMGATEVTLESTVFGKASAKQQKMVKFCADKIKGVSPSFSLLSVAQQHTSVKPMVEEVIGLGRELGVWS